MNAQVLITKTSASFALEVISIPRSSTLPSMISASTRFLAQPRLIMPTFVLISELPERQSRLLDGDVFVVFADGFAVFRYPNRITIQDANRDFLSVKLHG